MRGTNTVTLPARLQKRIVALARDDQDLVQESRAHWEEQCRRQHHCRIWEKLTAKERAQLRKQYPDCFEHDFVQAIASVVGES